MPGREEVGPYARKQSAFLCSGRGEAVPHGGSGPSTSAGGPGNESDPATTPFVRYAGIPRGDAPSTLSTVVNT